MAFRKPLKKLDEQQLWEYALRVLGRRAQSATELRQKLALRAASQQDVAIVLAKVKEYDLVNDQKLSETFASSRLQNQGYGQARVLRDLRSKRVASSVAENAVQKVFSGTDEKKLVQQFLARKYRNRNLAELLKDQKNAAAVYRRLRLAGFASNSILSVLRNYGQQFDAIEDQENEE